MLTEKILSQHRHVGLSGSGILQSIPHQRYCYYNCIYESGKRLNGAHVSALPHSEEECSSTTARCLRGTTEEKDSQNAQNRGGRMPPTAPVGVPFLNDTVKRNRRCFTIVPPRKKVRLTDESRHAFVGRESCSNTEHVLMAGAHASKSQSRQKKKLRLPCIGPLCPLPCKPRARGAVALNWAYRPSIKNERS